MKNHKNSIQTLKLLRLISTIINDLQQNVADQNSLILSFEEIFNGKLHFLCIVSNLVRINGEEVKPNGI